MKALTLADSNWEFVLKLLPSDWEISARSTGAVQRCRGFRSVSDLLRGLLMHVGLGCSLRETVALTKAAGWMAMSDVALLKKLRSSEEWLRTLCVGVLKESALNVPPDQGLRVRLVDATMVQEAGRTGSQWRLHYSLSVPSWTCDAFDFGPDHGKGTGESFQHFLTGPGECLIADRGYVHPPGLLHVHRSGGWFLVRYRPHGLMLQTKDGRAFEMLKWLRGISEPGQVDGCSAYMTNEDGKPVAVRVCAVRKSHEAVLASQRRLKRRARRKGERLRVETLEYAQWVIVLTTVPETVWNHAAVLEWYRVRWQIELAFKRIKSLAGFGHIPKSDPASSRAWLYGKLLIALLAEKMQRFAGAFSPWGGHWHDADITEEYVA